jgi:tRNA nucleotidyltransferase (CCA-adding enzyme)
MYEVGGCVRDELLGLKTKDIDFAVEAPSFDSMESYLRAQGFTIYLVTPEHFTIRGKFPKDHATYPRVDADFVLCRKDGTYSDARRPDYVEPGTLMDDLARRDFTVNAMARDEQGSILDPFDGRTDLLDGRLRCVGNAEDRMREDALRALRAIRFAVTKGFVWDLDLNLTMVSDWLPPLLASVSVERRREELLRCFQHDTRATLDMLCHKVPTAFLHAVFADGLWLMPTLKG